MYVLQRVLDVSAQLQQSQADLLGSQRRSAELQTQLDATSAKVQSLEKAKLQLTQASCSNSLRLNQRTPWCGTLYCVVDIASNASPLLLLRSLQTDHQQVLQL